MTTTRNPLPRREGESIADWQRRACESPGHYWRCLALTTRGTLCQRNRVHCPSHDRQDQPEPGLRIARAAPAPAPAPAAPAPAAPAPTHRPIKRGFSRVAHKPGVRLRFDCTCGRAHNLMTHGVDADDALRRAEAICASHNRKDAP